MSEMHTFDEKFFLLSSASNSEVKSRLIVKIKGVCLGKRDRLNWLKISSSDEYC
jgi:hypothetical protein